ncbi:Origin recognition complex subunit 5 [Varanus komodoensis]|nr:Origin recognition complex subunit 5 [Varanus komodoensis]
MKPLGEVIRKFGLRSHRYADDIQLCLSFTSAPGEAVAVLNWCLAEITSLVTLQLLTLVGHDDQLNGPRYKCNVNLDFIRAISRTVNFDIIKYLYDFL